MTRLLTSGACDNLNGRDLLKLTRVARLAGACRGRVILRLPGTPAERGPVESCRDCFLRLYGQHDPPDRIYKHVQEVQAAPEVLRAPFVASPSTNAPTARDVASTVARSIPPRQKFNVGNSDYLERAHREP